MSVVRLAIVGTCHIDVDGFGLTPASPHIFALLLFLSLRVGRPISRQALQTLFADGDSSGSSPHNLRQLLYRLRRMGLRFDELPSGLTLREVEIDGPIDQLRRMPRQERCLLAAAEVEVLPSYSPRLPRLFMDWLDGVKSELEARIRAVLLSDLEESRAAHAWTEVTRLCETLTSLDAANAEVVRLRAEALVMTGRREEALRVLDSFTTELSPGGDAYTMLQSFRVRVEKSAFVRREGALRGRGSCLAFLEADWERLSAEGARVTAVLGHAGLGKTRVADEYAARIALRGGRVLRFECDSQARQQPLSLFSHILPSLRSMRGSLGASPGYKASLALVRPANDGTERSIPDGLSLEARRADIQSALIDLLEAVTSERPLLLVVDDAHLLDEASRAVLRALTTARNAALLQVVLCARPSSGNPSLLAPARRSSVQELAPLSEQDSLALLLELGAGSGPDDGHVTWCMAQAAGNPFYLHQLATHTSSSRTAFPFDISSLAVSSYSSLRSDTRSVLETCLLLGRFATLTRTMFIARLDDHALLATLRELEEQDLVHFTDGHLRGPHALLQDALQALIPSTVSALLHRRIAAHLEEECVAELFTPELAWASAQSWLAAADPAAATRLLRRCAAHAADVGEPAAAVELLSQVPHSALPPKLLADLLDDLSRFANDGGCRAVAVASLRDRLSLSGELGEGHDRLNDLRLRLIEAELLAGGPLAVASADIAAILANVGLEPSLRARAATRLLAIADCNLDIALAHRVNNLLADIESDNSNTQSLVARAELVYHTTFGDIGQAYILATQLIESRPDPDATENSIRIRNYAGYAFYRIGELERAGIILESSYDFMVSHRLYSEALYQSGLRTDVALQRGDFEEAARWFARSERAARGEAPHQLNPNSGFYGNAGILAMRQGRYDEAELLIRVPQQHLSLLSGARYHAFALAVLLRLEQLRADRNLGRDAVAELSSLYEKGRSLGGQDPIVEALWCAHVLDGDGDVAAQLLRDYLFLHRRERTLPEWSLREATGADAAWQDYFSPVDGRHQ